VSARAAVDALAIVAWVQYREETYGATVAMRTQGGYTEALLCYGFIMLAEAQL